MTQFDQRYQHVETQYNADEINIHQPPLSLTEKQQRHNRVRMIERVQSIWIDEFLKSSLQEFEPLTLGLQRQPDTVIHPLQPRLQEFDLSEQALLAETSIEQVYDRANGELLILGVPGAGKTCELLKLTRTLLQRARQPESHPIPVVFLLSSSARTRPSLERRLAAELHTTTQIP